MNQVTCPHCGQNIEVSEALRKQVEQEVGQSLSKKHEKEIADLRLKIQEETKKKLVEEYTFKQKELSQELEEKNKKLEAFREQELQLRKEKRALEEREKELALEVEKRIDEERKNVHEKAFKQASEEHRLKDLEKEKVITDLKKALEEAQRKAHQGSQQTQGEVLELDIEHTLRNLFPQDTIEEVGKGVKGADIRQIVKSRLGRSCGVILWEFKNTKAWSDGWISKLKDDLRAEGADIPVIVSSVLPEEASSGIGFKQGVWICSFELVIPLATLLHDKLYEVAKQKFINENKGDSKEALYEYVTGTEFRQQVEAIVEVYQDMMGEVEKERVVFERIWKKREMQIRRLMSSTNAIYGSMQGIAGSSMREIKGLDLAELDTGEH